MCVNGGAGGLQTAQGIAGISEKPAIGNVKGNNRRMAMIRMRHPWRQCTNTGCPGRTGVRRLMARHHAGRPMPLRGIAPGYGLEHFEQPLFITFFPCRITEKSVTLFVPTDAPLRRNPFTHAPCAAPDVMYVNNITSVAPAAGTSVLTRVSTAEKRCAEMASCRTAQRAPGAHE